MILQTEQQESNEASGKERLQGSERGGSLLGDAGPEVSEFHVHVKAH